MACMAACVGGVAGSLVSADSSLRRSLQRDCWTSRSVSSSSSSTRSPGRLVVRASDGDDDFEARLAKLRKKGGSGTGKKAEERKAKREPIDPDAPLAAPVKKAAIEALPPVPLKEPISGGLPVTLGFSPYSERLNGVFAGIGLVALLAVELSSGQGIFKFHDGATLGVQLYFLLGCGALYVKTQKEKEAIWPK